MNRANIKIAIVFLLAIAGGVWMCGWTLHGHPTRDEIKYSSLHDQAADLEKNLFDTNTINARTFTAAEKVSKIPGHTISDYDNFTTARHAFILSTERWQAAEQEQFHWRRLEQESKSIRTSQLSKFDLGAIVTIAASGLLLILLFITHPQPRAG